MDHTLIGQFWVRTMSPVDYERALAAGEAA
jgi:hypothetical protein